MSELTSKEKLSLSELVDEMTSPQQIRPVRQFGEKLRELVATIDSRSFRDELFAAWNALNELRGDAQEAERRAFEALERAAPEPADDEMRAALVKAVEVIQVWHNMRVPEHQRSDLWDIYWRNAPEMKPIRSALTKISEQP